MQEGFDPYYKWLGIPPQEQPPHHYRLLAIPLFEADPEVIESAADQRMGHVRTFQTGPHSALSQQILNELATARVCLLSSDKKSAYDADLQALLAPAPPLPPPPSQSPASTILPSPPPPIEQTPPLLSQRSQSEIAAPPDGGVLSQPRRVFTPLAATLPDPTPPLVKVTRTTATRSRRLSLVTSALGITLLLAAAVVFGVIYTEQISKDAATLSQTPTVSVSQPIPEPVAPLPAEEEAPIDPDPVVSVDTMEPAVEAEQTSSEDPGITVPPTPEPAEPAVDAPMVERPTEAAETPAPKNRSLADLLKLANESSQGATDGMGKPGSTAEEAAEDSTSEKSPARWRIPKRAEITRAAAKLQSLTMPGSSSTLLAEGQKAERSKSEVYVLLTAAHNKAVAALDAESALRAIDLIESKFYDDFDDQRVESLGTIGQLISQQNNPQQFRDLADVALQASQKAQQEDNKPLAKNLGNVALEAAKQARDIGRQQSIAAHLEQL